MKKNNKVHIYYLLLGIGIGLVFGGIINFLTPEVKYKEYTEEEIREKARSLGMYDLDEIFQMNEKPNEELEESPKNQDLSEENTNKINENDKTNTQENKEIEESPKDNKTETETKDYIEFEVKRGDSSETIIDNLFNKNIIGNKEEFIKAVVRREAGRRLHYGTFKIPKGVNYDTIIDILTK